MRMYPARVDVSDEGNVIIEQPLMCENNQVITFHPDQIPVVIDWLAKARNEAYRKQST